MVEPRSSSRNTDYEPQNSRDSLSDFSDFVSQQIDQDSNDYTRDDSSSSYDEEY
jgi:hypothetical protein